MNTPRKPREQAPAPAPAVLAIAVAAFASGIALLAMGQQRSVVSLEVLGALLVLIGAVALGAGLRRS